MIVILSNSARERAAFSALCESHDWPSAECDSVRSLKKLLQRTQAGIVLTRHRLSDGYSDDVATQLAAAGQQPTVKLIVLIGAGTPSSVEARQVTLGADLVLRDPVRTDVLVRYLARYRAAQKAHPVAERKTVPASLSFARGRVSLADRRLQHGAAATSLTPRETSLVELLVQSAGEIVTYDTLYSEILGRKFRGDTSNMRVLFAKLSDSFRFVGLALRDCVEVIPKTGYRYQVPASAKIPRRIGSSRPRRSTVAKWPVQVVTPRTSRARPTAA